MTDTSRPPRPTVLEIDLDAAAGNVRAVRQLVGPERKIFAVIKADGYGHGAAEMGRVFVANGADALGVADLSEGVRLRRRGLTCPILVYPNSLPEAAPLALAPGLIPALVDLDGARAYAEAATGPCDVFVKIDVGLELAALVGVDPLEVPAVRSEEERVHDVGPVVDVADRDALTGERGAAFEIRTPRRVCRDEPSGEFVRPRRSGGIENPALDFRG